MLLGSKTLIYLFIPVFILSFLFSNRRILTTKFLFVLSLLGFCSIFIQFRPCCFLRIFLLSNLLVYVDSSYKSTSHISSIVRASTYFASFDHLFSLQPIQVLFCNGMYFSGSFFGSSTYISDSTYFCFSWHGVIGFTMTTIFIYAIFSCFNLFVDYPLSPYRHYSLFCSHFFFVWFLLFLLESLPFLVS